MGKPEDYWRHSQREAIHIVRARTDLEPISAMKLDETAPDHELEAGLYLCGSTNRVENARFTLSLEWPNKSGENQAWRWFDFLWSLHIMDYETRDNFNHLLIQFLSVLGLLTVLSGLALFSLPKFGNEREFVPELNTPSILDS